MTLFDVSHLSKQFARPSVLVLDDVSFSMEARQIVSVVGPSGCGKSTLLRIIAGLETPSSGTLTWSEDLGFPLAALMPQNDGLYEWERVIDNVALASRIQGHSRAAGRAEALALLEEFGLADFANAWPSQLSGGMRSRVALLRTVLAHPPLIALDEPFGALDALTRISLQHWLLTAAMSHELSVLMVTHDVDEAVTLSDRVLVLSPRPGRIVASVDVHLTDRTDDRLRSRPEYVAACQSVREALLTSSSRTASLPSLNTKEKS